MTSRARAGAPGPAARIKARLRGHIALASGSDVEAMTHVDAGLQLAMALGLRTEEARLRLTHATLMKRRGASERASAELERAKALVTAFGMSVGV